MISPLRLEPLEDRLTPATYTVDTTADAGPGSLRQAILDANLNPGPDTVAFAIGAAGSLQSIELVGGLPPVTDSVVIDGFSQGGPGYAGPPSWCCTAVRSTA
ncbi:hypothetical protein J0H58_11610 [bacterium]|nr:hypothetical protein [bacterium]